MLQSFAPTTVPEQGPPRLAALRRAIAAAGLDGFIIPRADAWQGEYVAPRDDRLAWLTGFTGSAGFCIVLPETAGIFIDGRYRMQVRSQVAEVFTPVHWPETDAAGWIAAHLPEGVIGFDPWLHTAAEIERIEAGLKDRPVTLRPGRNLVDTIWPDRPGPPLGPVTPHPEALAGRSARDKRETIAAGLRDAGQRAVILTLPDSICWILNIRGADVPRNPVVQAFAILHEDSRLSLFADAGKFDDAVRAHLGEGVSLRPEAAFLPSLRSLAGPVRVDPATAPLAVALELADAGVTVVPGDDPCRLPKARKTEAELQGARHAHLRDGTAMAEFLCWLDAQAEAVRAGAELAESAVIRALEGFRQATGSLHDLSFDTICGAGPNGAIVHYRVTETTDRRIAPDEVLLVDSGAQYRDGTTDITRTIAIGDPGDSARAAFTRVLQGMIAMSRARWPRGIAGRDLDAIARYPLWLAGQDYDHGTGHGVGAFLSVHEGPQRLSRLSHVALEPGMILSNEPGYYRAGAFGIRIENLLVVREAPAIAGGDDREMLCFETLTLAPIDRRMILDAWLSASERDWLDAYHAEVREKLSPLVSEKTRVWLARATRPL